MEKTLKSHVESKIFKGYMIISNLTEKEFGIIDSFCKEHFEDNRKRMLLSLIHYYDNNTLMKVMDDKLYLIYDDVDRRLSLLEDRGNAPVEKKEPKKVTWPGFKKENE